MIKVIASDMDGTLLGDDHRIAPETLAAVRRACDAESALWLPPAGISPVPWRN